MANLISADLRTRMMRCVAISKSMRGVARQFDVASTASRLVQDTRADLALPKWVGCPPPRDRSVPRCWCSKPLCRRGGSYIEKY